MRTKASVWWAVSVSLLLGVWLSGCRMSEERAAEQTARNFVGAAERGDNQAIQATLTTKARENMNAKPNAKVEVKQNKSDEVTVGQAVVTGDTAQVPLTIKGSDREQSASLKLRREEGEWRIYGMALKMTPNGTEFTIDFEHPESMFGEMFKALPEMMGEGMKKMGEGMGASLKAMGNGMQQMGEGFKKGLDTPGKP